jgi:hypothetical protein
VITLTDPAQQMGTVLAVQVLNPWKSAVKLDGYELVILPPAQVGANRPMDDPDRLRFTFPANAEIPGAVGSGTGSRVFYFVHYRSTNPGYKAVLGRDFDDTEPDAPTDSIEDVLIKRLGSDIPATNPRLEADVATQTIIDGDPSFPVTRMRNSGAGQRCTMVLRRSVPALSEPMVVDVLETDKVFFNYPDTVNLDDAALGFDAAYFAAIGYVGIFTPGQPDALAYLNSEIAGRVILTSSMTRPIRRTGATGVEWFSYAAVQPRPDETTVRWLDSAAQYFAHAWLTGGGVSEPPLPESDLAVPAVPTVPAPGRVIPKDSLFAKTDLDQSNRKSSIVEDLFEDRPDATGGWQLFVPNRPLRYVSELHQISTFASLCKDNQLNLLDAWTTVGQQLRKSMDWRFQSGTSDNNNPYLGVLDPSRFLPTGSLFTDGASIARDDSLALPLALRVFDCFEALDHPDALAQGRININTAPERVLQLLPHMAPADASTLAPLAVTNERVAMMLQYRDAWDPDFGVEWNSYRSGTILQLGQNAFGGSLDSNVIRRHDQSHKPSAFGPNEQYVFTRGFSTAGELAFLEAWEDEGAFNSLPGGAKGFLSPLGADGADNGSSAITRRLFEGDVGPSAEFDRVVDDPEERLALYRAVSNIVSSRSDVYGAWFILRGYDPKLIEATVVDSGLAPDALVRTAMDNPDTPFLPAYESRWFVIFDRSNCGTPTDRPRILLKAQLPSSRP